MYKDIIRIAPGHAADKVEHFLYDLYQFGKFQIAIKGLTVDKNREDLSIARSANKPLSNRANLPADIVVKVEAAKKVVKNKIDARLEKIKSEFDKILAQSLNGDGKLDFQKIQAEVSAIQDVTYRLNSYVNVVSKYNNANFNKEYLAKSLAELQKIA